MTYVVGDATHLKSKPLSGFLKAGETWVYDGTRMIPAPNEAFKFVDVDGTVLAANTSADTLHVSGVSGIKLTPVEGSGSGEHGILAEVSGLVSEQIPAWYEISGQAEGGSGIAVYASGVAEGGSGIAVDVAGRFALAEIGLMQGISEGRMIVCPAYYQTGSDQAVALTSAQHAIASLIVPEINFQVQGIARRIRSVTTAGSGTFEIRANASKLEPNGALNGSTTNAAPLMTANNVPSPYVVTAKDKYGNNCASSTYAFLAFNGNLDTESSTLGWAGLASSISIDNGPAVDKGSGKVGIPCTGHECSPGDRIKIVGSVNYNTVPYIVDAATTTNEIVITATYVPETFSSARFEIHACPGYPIYLALDLGQGNSLICNKVRFFSRVAGALAYRGFPSAWTRYGSNVSSPDPLNVGNWDMIHTVSGLSDPGYGACLEVAAITATPYRHHLFKLTGTVSTATATWLTIIQEIQLFAAQESDAPGEVLATLGTLESGELANWDILTTGTPYTLMPGKKYWISERGEASKNYSVSIRRSNTVTGSAHPDGMVSKYTTDGGVTWSQCLQNSLPALWNLIVNPDDPVGDGSKPVPQLCYGAAVQGNRVYIPGTGLITIPDEGVFLQLSTHDDPDPEFGYHVWLSHESGALHLSATKDEKEITGGVVHRAGAPGFRWIGDVYPVQCQPDQYGPVDVMDRCLIAYPGMKRIIGKPNPYDGAFSQTILGTCWRAYDDGTENWRIEFLSCATSEVALTACCRLAVAGNYALPSIGIDGKHPASSASAVQGAANHALLSSHLAVALSPGFHCAYPLVRGKGFKPLAQHRFAHCLPPRKGKRCIVYNPILRLGSRQSRGLLRRRTAMLKYVYNDGLLIAYANHPLQPWDELEEVPLSQEQIDEFLANYNEQERHRIRALREERFRVETDPLHWNALDLEKAGEDATQAWADWLAAKEAIRDALPYPEGN